MGSLAADCQVHFCQIHANILKGQEKAAMQVWGCTAAQPLSPHSALCTLLVNFRYEGLHLLHPCYTIFLLLKAVVILSSVLLHRGRRNFDIKVTGKPHSKHKSYHIKELTQPVSCTHNTSLSVITGGGLRSMPTVLLSVLPCYSEITISQQNIRWQNPGIAKFLLSLLHS